MQHKSCPFQLCLPPLQRKGPSQPLADQVGVGVFLRVSLGLLLIFVNMKQIKYLGFLILQCNRQFSSQSSLG